MSELLTESQGATSLSSEQNINSAPSQTAPMESHESNTQHQPENIGENQTLNDDFAARTLDDNDLKENNNAENAKRRIENRNRKKDREINELKSQVQYLTQAINTSNPNNALQHQQNDVNASLYNNQFGVIADPITGEQLTPGTQRYEVALFHHQQQLAQQRQIQLERSYRDTQVLNELNDKFEDALDDTASKYPDYYDVVKGKFSQEAIAATMYIDRGPELLYYIGKNPKEVQRISKLHPVLQQQAIAKHALEFASRNKVSSAPAPVMPIGETPSTKPANSFSNLVKNPSELRKYYRDKGRSGR